MSRIITTLVRNGHREKDVLWEYSMEKVQRYYDDIINLEHEELRRDAIKIYNAVGAAVLTEDNKLNKEKTKVLKEYLDNLDLEKVRKKEEERKRDPLKPLRGIVPFSDK